MLDLSLLCNAIFRAACDSDVFRVVGEWEPARLTRLAVCGRQPEKD